MTICDASLTVARLGKTHNEAKDEMEMKHKNQIRLLNAQVSKLAAKAGGTARAFASTTREKNPVTSYLMTLDSPCSAEDSRTARLVEMVAGLAVRERWTVTLDEAGPTTAGGSTHVFALVPTAAVRPVLVWQDRDAYGHVTERLDQR